MFEDPQNLKTLLDTQYANIIIHETQSSFE
jgi:hypothetical protein